MGANGPRAAPVLASAPKPALMSAPTPALRASPGCLWHNRKGNAQGARAPRASPAERIRKGTGMARQGVPAAARPTRQGVPTTTRRTLHYFWLVTPQAPRAVRHAHDCDASVRGASVVRQPLRHEPRGGPRERGLGGARPGVRRVRPLHRRAHPHQRGRPGGQQGAGLRHVPAADRRLLRPGHHVVRRAVQPVDVVPLQPLRRHAGEPDHQVHERLPAAAGDHHVPVSAGASARWCSRVPSSRRACRCTWPSSWRCSRCTRACPTTCTSASCTSTSRRPARRTSCRASCPTRLPTSWR